MSQDIVDAFNQARLAGRVRHRDMAQELGITEAQLIAAHQGADPPTESYTLLAIALRPEWSEILSRLTQCGQVMALTRNEVCVHERIGYLQNWSLDGDVGLFVGDIDLRLFLSRWHYGFAVVECMPEGMRYSVQFFDRQGQAIHKIYLRERLKQDLFLSLVDRYKTEQPVEIVATYNEKKEELPCIELDETQRALFHRDWASLKDTHDFFFLLKKYNLSRLTALRHADRRFAYPISVESVDRVLYGAQSTELSLMVFVPNPGAIQIYTGKIEKVVPHGEWINVMDPEFNLHVCRHLIAEAWVVKKPTVDGLVTAVEVFDQNGEWVLFFFGERHEGQPERSVWRQLVSQLTSEES